MFNFNWLSNVSDGWGRVLLILAFIIPLIFAFTMKRKYIYKDAGDNAWWRNLKLWVLVIVLVQIAIYLYF
jgi:putative flippase GtrA